MFNLWRAVVAAPRVPEVMMASPGKFYVVLEQGRDRLTPMSLAEDAGQTRMSLFEATRAAKALAKNGRKCTILEAFADFEPSEPRETKL